MHLAYASRVYGPTDPGRYPGSAVRQTAARESIADTARRRHDQYSGPGRRRHGGAARTCCHGGGVCPRLSSWRCCLLLEFALEALLVDAQRGGLAMGDKLGAETEPASGGGAHTGG